MVKIERSKGVINTKFKIVALSWEAGGTHAGACTVGTWMVINAPRILNSQDIIFIMCS